MRRVAFASTASLTDVVLELEQQGSAGQVNAAFEAAATAPLQGILGFTKPSPWCPATTSMIPELRSFDGSLHPGDRRSQLKVYACTNTEWAYSCRLADLACHVADVEGR